MTDHDFRVTYPDDRVRNEPSRSMTTMELTGGIARWEKDEEDTSDADRDAKDRDDDARHEADHERSLSDIANNN